MVTKVELFILEARKCIGTPFHRGGRLAGVGLDCWGLVVVAAGKLGIDLDDSIDFKRAWKRSALNAEQYLRQRCERVLEGMESGDILLFALGARRKRATHVGIRTDKGVLHCHSTGRAVVEHALDGEWLDGIVGVYRIRELW